MGGISGSRGWCVGWPGCPRWRLLDAELAQWASNPVNADGGPSGSTFQTIDAGLAPG